MLDGVFTMQGIGLQVMRGDRPDIHRPADYYGGISGADPAIDLDGAGTERSVFGGHPTGQRRELGSDGLVQRGSPDSEAREGGDSTAA